MEVNLLVVNRCKEVIVIIRINSLELDCNRICRNVLVRLKLRAHLYRLRDLILWRDCLLRIFLIRKLIISLILLK